MKTYDERTQSVMERVEHKRKVRRATVAAISTSAACIFVLVVSLVLFLPFGSTAAGGEYAHVLEALDTQLYHNNWEKLVDAVQNIDIGMAKDAERWDYVTSDAMPSGAQADSAMQNQSNAMEGKGASDEAGGERYVENTNLQVVGVKEGDVLKESTHYFYRLSRRNDENSNGSRNDLQLDVFDKAGLDTTCVATYLCNVGDAGWLIYSWEMYLSDDAATLTVLATGYDYTDDDARYESWRMQPVESTLVLSLDVRDLSHIYMTASKKISGYAGTARMIGGRLLLVNHYTADAPDDYADYTTYIPYVYDNLSQSYALTAPDAVYVCADQVYQLRYTVVTLLDAQLDLVGQVAFLGDENNVCYVNASRAYLVGRGTEGGNAIRCVQLEADSLRFAGEIEVDGTIDNQYWMDEYEGVLRVVATTHTNYDDRVVKFTSWGWVSNASLYCYRVGTWESVGKVEHFAPDGESVQSARFVGTKAYVCTAEVVYFTDPVYCFDLSDYANITCVDTGAIDGYSTSLVPFAEGTLLGIGVQSSNTVKLELYKETAESVASVASLTLGGDQYDGQGELAKRISYTAVNEYKSYLLDVADGIVGLPVTVEEYDYNTYQWKCKPSYILCVFRLGELHLAAEPLFNEGVDSCTRAAVWEGYVYIFTQSEFKVVALTDLLQ